MPARHPVPELREVCGELGWSDVETYIQSGNVVFRAKGTPAANEAALECAIEERWGLKIPVVVRTAEAWSAYRAQCPFAAACQKEPNIVLLLTSKKRPESGAEKALVERAANGEVVRVLGDAAWIHFAGGVGKSKLSPAVIDRAVGSPATGRNWRTVVTLDELVAQYCLPQLRVQIVPVSVPVPVAGKSGTLTGKGTGTRCLLSCGARYSGPPCSRGVGVCGAGGTDGSL